MRSVERVLAEERLHTVCSGARCPNRGECYSQGTATFMLMGAICTRDCRFCAVPTGTPEPLDAGEPEGVARAAERLGLSHVVVTSVTRDDLDRGGAGHFARTVGAVRRRMPGVTVEVLVPDFKGDREAVGVVIESGPDVFNHNLETARRLYPEVRPGADYGRSLSVLEQAARGGLVTKSGFMVGLGETEEEVEELLRDLLAVGCGMVTVGQYLQPEASRLQVDRYWEPREFEELERKAADAGFEAAFCGPLVRSSYRAREMLNRVRSPRTSHREATAG